MNLTTGVFLLQKFLSDVGEKFLCICCQEVVFEPVTTACGHNTCKVGKVLESLHVAARRI